MTTTIDRGNGRGNRATSAGKAAIYVRVSTQDQESGASLATQKADCSRFCQSLGLVPVAEFTDIQSGLKSDRTQYVEMLKAAKAGEFSVIVVWKMDRFGRDRIESGFQLRELQKIGVRVDSATEPNDSPLLRNILMDFAEEESRRISLRVSANKKTRSQDGKRTSKAPFGYSNAPHKESGCTLEPSEDAPLVTEAFRMYASGQHALGDLRDYIASGSTSPKRPQTRGGVHHILRNPVYMGKVRHGFWANSKIQIKSKEERLAEVFETEGDWPALVDENTWERVQQRLKGNRGRASGGLHSPFLFSGLVRCACGSSYTGKTTGGLKSGGRRINYYCTRRNNVGTCQNRSVSEPKIRAEVVPPIERLLASLSQQDVRAAVREQIAAQVKAEASQRAASMESLTERQGKLEARLTKLEDSYLDGDLTKDRYLTRRDAILEELAEIKSATQARPRAPQVDVEGLFSMADALQSTPPDDAEWREILESTLSRITIVDGQIRVEWKPFIADLVKTVMGA